MGIGQKQQQLDFFRREPVHETKVWTTKDQRVVVEHRTLHIFPANYLRKILDSLGSNSTATADKTALQKAE